MSNDGMFKKIKNKSVVQTVVDSITKVIISGELKPGDKIPTEMELAESFGVGRNSIREAIKILVYYGILEIRRAEGTFVCNGFNKIMIDPMVYGVILHQSEDYVNLMELREMMEVGVMRLAIAKYDEAELEKLHEKLEILKRGRCGVPGSTGEHNQCDQARKSHPDPCRDHEGSFRSPYPGQGQRYRMRGY